MPLTASARPRTKRAWEQSRADDKADVVVAAEAAHTSDSPLPLSKRPRRSATVTKASTAKMEDDDGVISAPSVAPAFKPGPNFNPELEPRGKIKREANAKAEPAKAMEMANGSDTINAPAQDRQHLEEAQILSQSPHPTPDEIPKEDTNEDQSKELKKAREEKWKKWCDARKWIRIKDPGYKQKVGNREAYRSDAMSYYRLKAYEIDTLPYVPFPNVHNLNSFGRSYNNSNLRTLVSRKFAYLAGLDEQFDPETQEVKFLKEGWKLFEVDTKRLEDAMREKKNRSRKPLKLRTIFDPQRVVNPNVPHHHGTMKNRPLGAWSTRVYEGGKYVGDRLDFQFDPSVDDFGDVSGGYERFWPRGADWAWGLCGICSCCEL